MYTDEGNELVTSIHSRIVEKVNVLIKPDKADYNLAFTTDCWSDNESKMPFH